MCVLNLPAPTIPTVYIQRKRILKMAKVTIGSTGSKLLSFSWHLLMYEIEGLSLEWIDECTKHGILLSNLVLKEESIFLICWNGKY